MTQSYLQAVATRTSDAQTNPRVVVTTGNDRDPSAEPRARALVLALNQHGGVRAAWASRFEHSASRPATLTRLLAAGDALAALAFANSLDGGFVIDDGSAVRTNQDLRPETPIWQLLRHDFWGRPLAGITSNKSYRPLTVLTFRANFALHGLRVEGYHAANVLLHAACTGLVGLLSRRVLAPGDAACRRTLAAW